MTTTTIDQSSHNAQPPPPPYSKAPPTTDIVAAEVLTKMHQQQQEQQPHISSSSSVTTLDNNQQEPPPPLSQPRTPTTTSSTVSIHDIINKEDVDFNQPQPPTNKHPLVSTVSMVAKHPIVMNAVKYYETSKRNYPSFNYAANIVEAAAIPVVNKIELNLNQRHKIRKESLLYQEDEMNLYSDNKQENDNLIKKKRRFSNASTTSTNSISSSYDVKKRLQFCIHILKLANSNISSKIDYLQDKLSDMTNKEGDEIEPIRSNDVAAKIQPECQKNKTEIVGTVKKIINLTTQYHADDDLKDTIKKIILALPETVKEHTVKTSENDKIFVFANESLEMIRKLTNVFSVQLNNVENWVTPNEQPKDIEMKDEKEIDSSSTRCSSEEPDHELTTATKRMKISENLN